MRTGLYCCIGLLLVCTSAPAQYPTGRVVGTVTDANGAPISGAKIVVTNSNTGVDRETLTDTEGNFQVAQLPIGSYRVSAEHSSFQKVVTGAQLLQFNESVRFDIRMEAGDARQTVQVEAQATQQNMDTADLYPTQTIEKPHAVYIAPGATFFLLWSEKIRPFSELSTDALLEQFHRLLNEYRPEASHYKATLRNLRATVAELARRHKFGLDQATDYSEFLFKYGLFGKEPKEPMVDGDLPPPEVLQREKDFRSALKSLATTSSRAVISGSGVPLGLLEADPAEHEQQLACGESVILIRRFRPIHGVIGDKNIRYDISLSADWHRLPSGFEKEDDPASVKTVASNGQLHSVVWKFGIKAGCKFPQFPLSINGVLQEYYAGKSDEPPQTIEVPVPIVSIVPVPTFLEKEIGKFSFLSAIVGAILGIFTSLLATHIYNNFRHRRQRHTNEDLKAEKEDHPEVQSQQPLDTAKQATPTVQGKT